MHGCHVSNLAFPSTVRWDDTHINDSNVKCLDLDSVPSLSTPAISPLQAALQAFLKAICSEGPLDTINTIIDTLRKIHLNSLSLGVEVGTALSILPISQEHRNKVDVTIISMIQAQQ